MSSKPYHHGHLRAKMIEKGLEILNEDGTDALSLRKISAACGVSHSAPYSHFANKSELLAAIESHVTGQFANALKESVKDTGVTLEGLYNMCYAYVMFFAKNPEYYSFVFINGDISAGGEHKFEPYDFFRAFMDELFDAIDYPQERRLTTVVAHLSMIHGLASIAIMTGLDELPAWEVYAAEILSQNYMIFKENNNA